MNAVRKIAIAFVLAAAFGVTREVAAADEQSPNPLRRAQAGGEGQGPGPRGPRFQQGQFQPRGFQAGRAGGMGFESVLTEEQREKLGEEMFNHRQQARELNERFGRLRRELDEAMFAERLDEALVREKSKELAEIDVERSLMRARAFAKIRPMLSEEQLSRIKEMRGEMGRGPAGGPDGFRGPREGDGPVQQRFQRPRSADAGDDVLPPPRPASDREK